MKKGLFYMCALFLLMTGVAGCSKDEEPTLKDYNFTDLATLVQKGEIPTQFMDESEFPNWIQESINSLPDYYKPLWIFKYNWKGSTHYLFYYALMSGPYDSLYTQDGEKLNGHKWWDDIRANSYDWTLVYEARP